MGCFLEVRIDFGEDTFHYPFKDLKKKRLKYNQVKHVWDTSLGCLKRSHAEAVCSNSRKKETRTAEDKLPNLFTEAFWGCRK